MSQSNKYSKEDLKQLRINYKNTILATQFSLMNIPEVEFPEDQQFTLKPLDDSKLQKLQIQLKMIEILQTGEWKNNQILVLQLAKDINLIRDEFYSSKIKLLQQTVKSNLLEKFSEAYWHGDLENMKQILQISKKFDFFDEIEKYYIENQIIEVRTVSQHTFQSVEEFYKSIQNLNDAIIQTIDKNMQESSKDIYDQPLIYEIFTINCQKTTQKFLNIILYQYYFNPILKQIEKQPSLEIITKSYKYIDQLCQDLNKYNLPNIIFSFQEKIYNFYKLLELQAFEQQKNIQSLFMLQEFQQKRLKYLCPVIYKHELQEKLLYQFLQKANIFMKNIIEQGEHDFFSFLSIEQQLQKINIQSDIGILARSDFKQYRLEVIKILEKRFKQKLIDFLQSIGKRVKREGQGPWLEKLKIQIDGMGKGAQGLKDGFYEQINNGLNT